MVELIPEEIEIPAGFAIGVQHIVGSRDTACVGEEVPGADMSK